MTDINDNLYIKNSSYLQFANPTDPYVAIDLYYGRMVSGKNTYDIEIGTTNSTGTLIIPRLLITGHKNQGQAAIINYEPLQFKDTGNSLAWHWSAPWGYTTVDNYRSPDSTAFINVFCSIVSPLNHSQTMNPHLYVDRGFFVEDDVMTFGAFMTASDPQKGGVGGGAINMGHGLERSDDPPRINLTDDSYHTLYITSGTTVGVGADAVLADLKAKNVYANVFYANSSNWTIAFGNGSGGVNTNLPYISASSGGIGFYPGNPATTVTVGGPLYATEVKSSIYHDDTGGSNATFCGNVTGTAAKLRVLSANYSPTSDGEIWLVS